MNLLFAAILLLGSFLVAEWLTGRFRSYAVARRLVDIPNVRSSHTVAVPRGGGMAIVLTTLIALPLVVPIGGLTPRAVWGLWGGGSLVAIIGFADDHRPIAPRLRLLGHFVAAACILASLGGLPPLPLPGFVVELGWFGYVLAALYLVWVLNLTNFMDGIDGIAGVEAITVSLAGALLYAVTVRGNTQWLVPLVLAAATLGFLMWNWPPAKVFLGDAGSGFLGLVLATLSLQAALVLDRLFWSWVILLGAFVVDATVTLIRRVARGDKVFEAHRSHAYQHAAQRWGHRAVTIAVGAFNLLWLFPIALLVANGVLEGLLGVLIAYSPLVAVALWLRAGKPSVYPW